MLRVYDVTLLHQLFRSLFFDLAFVFLLDYYIEFATRFTVTGKQFRSNVRKCIKNEGKLFNYSDAVTDFFTLRIVP